MSTTGVSTSLEKFIGQCLAFTEAAYSVGVSFRVADVPFVTASDMYNVIELYETFDGLQDRALTMFGGDDQERITRVSNEIITKLKRWQKQPLVECCPKEYLRVVIQFFIEGMRLVRRGMCYAPARKGSVIVSREQPARRPYAAVRTECAMV